MSGAGRLFGPAAVSRRQIRGLRHLFFVYVFLDDLFFSCYAETVYHPSYQLAVTSHLYAEFFALASSRHVKPSL